jgi:hypothetical protein
MGIMRWSAVKEPTGVKIELAKKARRRIMAMQIKSIGIDLGKTTFHLIALGNRPG